MGLGRRHQRREERRSGDGRVHYRMRQRIFSIGDDFWIENDRGERVYKVDGKALRLRKTLVFEDAARARARKIQERMSPSRTDGDRGRRRQPDGDGQEGADQPAARPLGGQIDDGPDLDVQGNILDHEYTFGEGRDESPRSPRSGSGSPTPTAWRSSQARSRDGPGRHGRDRLMTHDR